MSYQVGVVVPTMGSWVELILNCLRSIRESGDAFILIVAPDLEFISLSRPAEDVQFSTRSVIVARS